MTEFTPGPWASHEHTQTDTYTIYVAGRNWESWGIAHIGYTKEDKANARLIAAAPDLLEALTEYIRLFEAHCITNHSTDDKDFTGYLAEKARAAIAKATGEE